MARKFKNQQLLFSSSQISLISYYWVTSHELFLHFSFERVDLKVIRGLNSEVIIHFSKQLYGFHFPADEAWINFSLKMQLKDQSWIGLKNVNTVSGWSQFSKHHYQSAALPCCLLAWQTHIKVGRHFSSAYQKFHLVGLIIIIIPRKERERWFINFD